ncbi:MAG: hypothetical protein GYA17_18955, partial [Chloroflexi bacterium]|nr:hypothetical protein [Chloroflexota bacterium]
SSRSVQAAQGGSQLAILPALAPATRTPFQPLPTSTVTQTPTITPSPTATPIPPTETPTATPLPTDTPAPTEETWPPTSAMISNIYGYPQYYSLDCEARSAVDLASYFGLAIDELDFLDRMPLSSDPDEGFVGSFYDPRGQVPPNSYGVHAAPVANLLREYGLNTAAAKGMSYDTIRSEIASGRPVMVWVINNTLSGYPVSYTAPNGNTTTVAAYEHTVLAIGYDPYYVTLLDGSMVYQRSVDLFLASWGVLGNMGITVGDPSILN